MGELRQHASRGQHSRRRYLKTISGKITLALAIGMGVLVCVLCLRFFVRAQPADSPELLFPVEPESRSVSFRKLIGLDLPFVGSFLPSDRETLELADALNDERLDLPGDIVQRSEAFIERWPDSPYTPALRNKLALHYDRTGRYSRAAAHWDEAWQAARELPGIEAREVADESLANLALILANNGRVAELESVYQEASGMLSPGGMWADRYLRSVEKYVRMKRAPEKAFRCGVHALWRVATALGVEFDGAALSDTPGKQAGTSIGELEELSKQYGLGLRAAERIGIEAFLLLDDDAPLMPTGFLSSQTPTLSGNSFDLINRNDRNTFHWNPQQWAALGANTNFSSMNWTQELKRARIQHWLWNYDFHLVGALSHLQLPSPDGTTEGQVFFFDYAGTPSTNKAIIGSQVLPKTRAWKDPAGNTLYETWVRNTAGNPTSHSQTYTRADGTLGVRTRTMTYSADGIDLLSRTDFHGNLVEEWTYNTARQVLTHKQRPQASTTYTTTFTYDAALRKLTETNPNSQTTTFTYFPAGDLKTLVDPRGKTTQWTYDSEGRMTRKRYAGETYDHQVYGYNANGWTTSRRLYTSATTFSETLYTYDAGWNLDTRVTNGTTTENFDVGDRNQLTLSPLVGGGSTTPTYDPNGNLTALGAVSYAYNAENQLIRVQDSGYKTEYLYDGQGRKRKESFFTWSAGAWSLTTETRFIYDGRRVVQERNGSNVPTVGYTRGKDLSTTWEGAGGIGGLLARSSGYSSGSWSTHDFYHADAGGNVTALISNAATPAIRASYKYDPYGRIISQSGSIAGANTFRFSSKQITEFWGLYDYGFRFYSPHLQRWPNRDPIAEDGGLNLYGHVYNNPINFIDPLGLSGWMDMRALPNYTGPSTLTPSEIPIEDVANFGGGLGDALSLNLTKLGRDAMGIDSVDTSSVGYKAGGWSTCAIGVGRLAYAGLAKAGSIFAKTPQAASAFRDALKKTFRGGFGKNWRPANVSGKTGDALRASAGRTNPGMNVYGAGVAGTGAANAIVDDEGDR